MRPIGKSEKRGVLCVPKKTGQAHEQELAEGKVSRNRLVMFEIKKKTTNPIFFLSFKHFFSLLKRFFCPKKSFRGDFVRLKREND